MSDEMTFTLHSPLTEEEWDMLTDVDLDHTSEITFHTKHGKEVTFVKRKTGKWETYGSLNTTGGVKCSECGFTTHNKLHRFFEFAFNYCPNCGAKMEGSK